MVKYWSIEKKAPFFEKFSAQIASGDNSAIPILRLFDKLVSD